MARASALGLDPVGVAPLSGELRKEYFLRWLADGQHGDMTWLARDPERRINPQAVLPEARCILGFGCNYFQEPPLRRGRIARYALGKDYHKVVLNKLKQICRWLQEMGGHNRPYTDTGPLLEKPVGALAGLGWQGKNTMLLNEAQGQWLFLGFILTSLPFVPDVQKKDRCGTCVRCIEVCPTKAITAPYQLDARLCIAYLTIELQGSIPLELRDKIGDHLYGCDDCLEVCPWNRWAQQTREAAFNPRDFGELRDQLLLTEEQFNLTFAGSPIRRLKRTRWLRNTAVVLGNIGTVDDLPALQVAAQDPDPLISEHARWAIAKIQNSLAEARRSQSFF